MQHWKIYVHRIAIDSINKSTENMLCMYVCMDVRDLVLGTKSCFLSLIMSLSWTSRISILLTIKHLLCFLIEIYRILQTITQTNNEQLIFFFRKILITVYLIVRHDNVAIRKKSII